MTDSRSLTEILREYDTLKKESLNHRIIRRSIGNGRVSYEREVHFRSLGRYSKQKLLWFVFSLTLIRGEMLVSLIELQSLPNVLGALI